MNFKFSRERFLFPKDNNKLGSIATVGVAVDAGNVGTSVHAPVVKLVNPASVRSIDIRQSSSRHIRCFETNRPSSSKPSFISLSHVIWRMAPYEKDNVLSVLFVFFVLDKR